MVSRVDRGGRLRALCSPLNAIFEGIMHEGFAFITIDENDFAQFRDFLSEYDVCIVHKQSCSLLKSRNTGSNQCAGVPTFDFLTFDYFQRRSV